jgi:hypothetical protein
MFAMAGDGKSQALIDPRRLNLRGLAERLNLPVAPLLVDTPPHDVLKLGRLMALEGMRHAELEEFISRKVAIFNGIAGVRPAMTLKEYVYRVSHVRRGKNDYDPFDDANATKDFRGYLTYLLDHDPHLAAVLTEELERPRFIQETRDRRAHSLVTGGSRSGKSELVKLLVHHYVRHPELGGVLVVDPHGDMARQIARWREFAGAGAGRLVYLDAGEGMAHGAGVPALNPLVRGSAKADELATLSGQLADALAYFGGDGEGQTPQMQRLAAFCLQMLLEIDGSTLLDLMNGLTVPPRREKGSPTPDEPQFVSWGKSHPDDVVHDFFLNDWNGESYRSTRDALKRRLSTHLRAPTFRRMMTAPDPLNLEALLNAGKVVVVNCGIEGEAGDALGRFIMAQVAAIGRRRLDNARLERHPVHVFVDEATQLMAPPFVKILERFAKARIWLTMAQQGAGEGGEREFVNRVRRSTGLKFLGRSGNVGELLRMVDIGRANLPQLKQGEFIVAKTGEEKAAMLLRTLNPSPLKDDDNAMSAAEWATVLKRQFAAYYRQPPKALPAPASPSAPASTTPDTQATSEKRWRRE